MSKNVSLGIGLYRITSRMYFYLPFLVSYFYNQNLNILNIEIILALYGVTLFLFTTLKIKNRFLSFLKHRETLILSECLKVIGLLIIILSNNIIGYVTSQLFLGAGYSIGVGIDSLFLQEYVEDSDSIQAKTNSYMFISLLISGIIGSFMFSINIRLPFIASICSAVVSIIFSLAFLPNDRTYYIQKKNNVVYAKSKDIFISELDIKENYYLALTYGCIRGIALSLFVGFLPYLLYVNMKVNNYTFITILTSFTFIGYIASKKSIIINIKTKKLIPLLNSILFIALVCIFTQKIFLIILGVLMLGLSSGPMRPLVMKYIVGNADVKTKVINQMEMIYSIINIIILLIGGLLYKLYRYEIVIMFIMVIFFSYILYLYFINKTIQKLGGVYNEN